MKRTLLILGFVSLLFFGFMEYRIESVPINTNNSLSAKQVIENYFKFYNEKNRGGMLSTLTRWNDQPNVVFGLKNLIFIKLVSIGNKDMNATEHYLAFGRGRFNGVKKNNVVSYKVIYVSLYSKTTPPWSSGIHTDCFTLIRESDNAPWLIDDSGQ
ncbi:hypothetical protein CEB3_c19900 [Peptococcaceae bacterium CEB3]|nr:hypothetical protein CEB3_c19900 [Peptococcaceae bacterium CEB3]